MAGIVTLVAVVGLFIYLCARTTFQDGSSTGIARSRQGGSTGGTDEASSAAAAATAVEMGSMAYFFEDIQNERPIRFSSQQLVAFTRNYAQPSCTRGGSRAARRWP